MTLKCVHFNVLQLLKKYIGTECGEFVLYRKAAKGEHLAVYEENSCVVTSCCHLHTRTWQGLHQSGRTPSTDRKIWVSFGSLRWRH